MPYKQKGSLSVMTLNVGRFLQERTRAYLKRLVAGDNPALDVLCLQDIPQRDIALLRKRWPFVSYKSMTNHLIDGVRAEVGVAICSKYPMANDAFCFTWGNGELKDLQGVNDKNERYPAGPEADALVEATEDRVAICVTVIKDSRHYNIATTHGFWVRGGVTNNQQHESTQKLLSFLKEQCGTKDGLLLVGDMNFGRGSEMYRMFMKAGLRDCIPSNIVNTLDPEHPAVKKGLRVVTDWFFGCLGHNHSFVVENVQLRPGVSDHCALSATISMIET